MKKGRKEMGKYFCLFVAFSIVLLSSSISLADFNDGLVAYYPFDGNTNDESGNQLHGTVYNGASLTEDRFGDTDSAYYFDGINSNKIDLPSDQVRLILNGAQSITASAWVYNSGPGDPYRNVLTQVHQIFL
jgi:hypothetical protein